MLESKSLHGGGGPGPLPTAMGAEGGGVARLTAHSKSSLELVYACRCVLVVVILCTHGCCMLVYFIS